jgi:hypothetical protein
MHVGTMLGLPYMFTEYGRGLVTYQTCLQSQAEL